MDKIFGPVYIVRVETANAAEYIHQINTGNSDNDNPFWSLDTLNELISTIWEFPSFLETVPSEFLSRLSD